MKTITRILDVVYEVKLSSSSPFQLFGKNSYGAFEPATYAWPMDPTAARLNKRYLRVALLGTVPTPDATEETTLREPTISAPQEISIHSRRLPFSLEELRIIDSRTSEILASFDSTAKVDTQNDSQLANSTSMPRSSTVSGVAPIHDGPDTVKHIACFQMSHNRRQNHSLFSRPLWRSTGSPLSLNGRSQLSVGRTALATCENSSS
jgi:hypothetical protein